jgi:ribosome-associated protein
VELDDIRTATGIVVPDAAVTWRFSRSSAPGGQHVNTSSTKVELRCDVTMLQAPERVRTLLLERLGPVVRVQSSQERSQRRNRERAVTKLCAVLDAATEVESPRRPTRPTRGSVQRRLADKERQSRRKTDRNWRPGDDRSG